MDNGVLVLPVREEAMIADFADDLAVVVTATHPEDVEVRTVRTVNSWLERAGIILAVVKTEAVYITKRRKKNIAIMKVGGYAVVSPSELQSMHAKKQPMPPRCLQKCCRILVSRNTVGGRF